MRRQRLHQARPSEPARELQAVDRGGVRQRLLGTTAAPAEPPPRHDLEAMARLGLAAYAKRLKWKRRRQAKAKAIDAADE